MKSRQQNDRIQNAKIQTRQDIYGMKKTKYRKLTTYQQKCRKRPGVEATHGRSITNSRKPDIHEKQIKNFEENEIKAKISNGIWKFRTKFWNDSIKIYIGHVVHTSVCFTFYSTRKTWLNNAFSLVNRTFYQTVNVRKIWRS